MWQRKRPSKHGDAIALTILIFWLAALAIAGGVAVLGRDGRQRFNFGFAPDFQCTPAGLDPAGVCIRKPFK
jgi:hypothetical protein